MWNFKFLLGGISFNSASHSSDWAVEGIELHEAGGMESNVTCFLAAVTSKQNAPAIHVEVDDFTIVMKIFARMRPQGRALNIYA